MAERTAEEIQRDIEQARASLASAIDQLAERTNPRRLADQLKRTLREQARSPRGKAVMAGAGTLVALLVIRRIRHR